MAQVRDRAFDVPIRVDFDAVSDVLYIAKGSKPAPSESDRAVKGVELRYALSNGAPSGVTVIGFKYYHWNERVPDLAKIISKHISLPIQSIADEISRAIK